MNRLSTLTVVGGLLAAPLLTSTAVAQCVTDVDLQDTVGALPPPGLIIRLEPGSAPRELVWSGATVHGEGLPCGRAKLAVGWYSGEGDPRRWHRLAELDVSIDGSRIEVTVPRLRHLVVRTVDTEGRPVLGTTVLMVAADEWPTTAQRPIGYVGPPSSTGTTLLFLAPAEYRVGISAPVVVRRAVVGGARVQEPEVGRHALEVMIDVTTHSESIEFVMEPGVGVRGRVRGEDDRGVPAIQIVARQGGSARFFGETDSDGAFAGLLDEGPVQLEAFDADGRYVFDPPTVTASRESTGEVVFVARPRKKPERQVVIVDERGGPVSGATIVTRVEGSDQSERTRSDARGIASVECVPSAPFSLDVAPPRSDGLLSYKEALPAQPCSTVVKAVLKLGGVLSLVVRHSDGRRAEGVDIVLESEDSDEVREARTDGEGNAQYGAVSPGRYRVLSGTGTSLGSGGDPPLLLKASARSRDADARQWPIEVEVKPGRQRLELVTAPGRWLCISARDRDGVPRTLGAVTVHRNPTEPSLMVSREKSRTARRPTCVGPMPPGDYYVRAGNMLDGLVQSWWPGTVDPALATPVVVPSAGERIDIGPMLVESAGSVRACCFPHATSDGAIPIVELIPAESCEHGGAPRDPENGQGIRGDREAMPHTALQCTEWKRQPPQFVEWDRPRGEMQGAGQARALVLHCARTGRWYLRACAAKDGECVTVWHETDAAFDVVKSDETHVLIAPHASDTVDPSR